MPPFLLAVLLPACAPPPYDALAAEAVSTAPSLEIVWPLPETTHVGCAVVVVDVENLQIAAFGEPVDGEGHFHVFYPSGGTTGYTACAEPYCLVDLATANVGNISIEARLTANDHQELADDAGEPIGDSLPITLEAGPCEATSEPEDEYDTGDTGQAGDTGDTGARR